VKARRVVFAALAAFAASACVWAVTIDKLDVTRESERYSLVADAHLAATPASIYAVLVDYDDNRFCRILSAYKESRYLDPDTDGTPIVFTRMESCVLRHCTTLDRVERLETRKPNWVKSSVLPERSSFKYSTSEWVLEPDGAGGTNLTYKLELEPDFWVPPLIGPWRFKRALSDAAPRAVRRIETLARELEGLPVDPTGPPPGQSSR
jgi:hypothetical protein